MTNPNYFWGIITLQNIWKDAGWGTMIFLAAIAGNDPERYEAAVIDGASRLRQIWHITLPAIRPVIIILLILRLGNFADVGFEQILLMMNPLVTNVAEIFDTYEPTTMAFYEDASAWGITVGMFRRIVGLILILAANYTVRKLGHEGLLYQEEECKFEFCAEKTDDGRGCHQLYIADLVFAGVHFSVLYIVSISFTDASVYVPLEFNLFRKSGRSMPINTFCPQTALSVRFKIRYSSRLSAPSSTCSLLSRWHTD